MQLKNDMNEKRDFSLHAVFYGRVKWSKTVVILFWTFFFLVLSIIISADDRGRIVCTFMYLQA